MIYYARHYEPGSRNRRGSWVLAATRVLGVWILSWFAFAAIFIGFLLDRSSPVLQWVAITFVVLISPAYGCSEYRAARRRNQSQPARVAKIVAILLLVINAVILALVWLMAEGLKHIR